MGGGGLDGCLVEQGLQVGIQECLKEFRRGCVDYFSRQFVLKWDSPNCEGELATARTASLLLLLLLRRAPRALESGPSERQHLLGVSREDSEWGRSTTKCVLPEDIEVGSSLQPVFECLRPLLELVGVAT